MITTISRRLTFAPLAGAACLVLLAGCDTAPKATPLAAAPVETRSVAPATTPPPSAAATTTATPQSRVATIDLASSRSATAPAATAMMVAPTQRVLYFDFDSFAIKDDYKPVLEGFSRFLGGDRTKRMVVEGHTDERGGREYNLALGQKRAEAVVKSLTLLGASESQLEAVSFGEERPAAQGSDESAWSKNRRAELKDR